MAGVLSLTSYYTRKGDKHEIVVCPARGSYTGQLESRSYTIEVQAREEGNPLSSTGNPWLLSMMGDTPSIACGFRNVRSAVE